jgi:8-oxo-dGTP pyrophosphatase MutT (NUDIX family)
LLFEHTGADGSKFWAPPGGGLESGETFEDAALREANEELGISAAGVRFLWKNAVEFIHLGEPVRQTEKFFLIESGVPDFTAAVRDVHTQERIGLLRWWTLAELETTREAVFPRELVAELRKISN